MLLTKSCSQPDQAYPITKEEQISTETKQQLQDKVTKAWQVLLTEKVAKANRRERRAIEKKLQDLKKVSLNFPLMFHQKFTTVPHKASSVEIQ